ncbi:MAG: sigma-70 family RNA polymerase sigma factor [Deltaproteobacteria bacterium]|nr:sigma-70 family RNA polymerase sigma factor [Deltaproteobacteria bacterium]
MSTSHTSRHTELAWIHAIARRLAGASDAEDVAQEAVIAAQQTDDKGRDWLFGVVRNQWRMRARAATRRRSRERHAPAIGRIEDPEARAVRTQVAEILRRSLESLSDRDRRIVTLRYCEDWNASEIGDALGLPPATVRTRLRRSLAKLRERLELQYEGHRPWQASFLLLPSPSTAAHPVTASGGASTTAVSVSAIVILSGLVALGVVAAASQRSDDDALAQQPRHRAGSPELAVSSEPSSSSGTSGARALPSSSVIRWRRLREALLDARNERIERVERTLPDAQTSDDVDDAADDLRLLFFPEHGSAMQPLLDALSEQAAESLKECARLHPHDEGTLRVRARIIAEVDIGVVVESVTVQEDSVGDVGLVECVEASTYAFHFPEPTGAVFKLHDFTIDMQAAEVSASGVAPLDRLPEVLERYPTFRERLPLVLERYPGIAGPLRRLLEREDSLRTRLPDLARLVDARDAPPLDRSEPL